MFKSFKLSHREARNRAIDAVRQAPEGFIVKISESSRSGEQNSLLWAMLDDVSRQVNWHGRQLSPTDWKHLFTSSLKKMDVVPNLGGSGFVALGLSTSVMTKKEFSDLVELINAFAAEHNVKFQTNERAA